MLTLLEELYQEGLSLWVEGEALKLDMGEEQPDPALIQQLKDNKPALIALLQEHNIGDLDAFEDFCEERFEYDDEDEQASDASSNKQSEDNPEDIIEAIYPATSLQQGFIYHHISEPGDDAYRVQMLFDFHQQLDIAAFKEAWRVASLQYPILRTAFDWEGEVLQVITRPASIGEGHFSLHDIRDLPDVEKDARIVEIQREDRQQPFDLTQPGLIRITLIRQQDALYTILLSLHHSITDGWSSANLWQSVHRHYSRLLEGLTPEYRVDTAYPATQEFFIQQKAATDDYWAQRRGRYPAANDVSSMLTKPIDLAQVTAIETPVEQELFLDGDNYQALKKLCQQEGVTINVVTQFAWHKLLQTYSGDNYTIVGTTVSGRDVPVEGIEESVGLYINTLPLVVDWSDKTQSVRATLAAIQQEIAALNTHSAVSLASLQQSADRMFHSLFVFESYPMPEGSDAAETGGVAFRGSVEKVDYPLSIMAYEENNGLVIRFSHGADFLSDSDARDVLSKLQHVLLEVAKDPAQSCMNLSIIDPGERQQLLVDLNQTAAPFERNKTLPELFEIQAAKTPHNVAIVLGAGENQQSITFAELNARANQLAHAIRDKYAAEHQQPMMQDTLIGLYFDRCIDMVVAMLAVQKAGGAYVPISPQFPMERRAFILQDTNAALLITQAKQSSTVDAMFGEHDFSVAVMLADDDAYYRDAARVTKVALPFELQPTDLAYVIYTSGTTGKPKGALMQHLGAVNYVAAQHARCYGDECEKVLWFASYVFDASILEIFYSLSYGMTGYMCTDEQRNPEGVAQMLLEHGVHFTFQTPALLKQLIGSQFPELKVLMIGGEAPGAEVMEYFSHQTCAMNVYGPTETTVIVTMHEYQTGDSAKVIGRPLNNVRLYILDDGLNPVPHGTIGELYISGPGLARGYLNRPELNERTFLPNPFVSQQERDEGYGRMYRTGDLVRYDRKHSVEYQARADNQVKIRGYRIELGEIEARLVDIVGTGKAIVIDRKRDGNAYLAAYVVQEPDSPELNADALVERLGQSLPDYMIPATFTAIDAIPMTINGKIDKRALPEPEWVSADSYVAPRTELETQLCGIWQEVLSLPQVGIDDNFFRIGGDSIISIQLVSKLRAAGFELQVKAIFEAPTVAQLAAWLEGGAEHIKVIAEHGELTGEFALLPVQEWFFQQQFAAPHHWNQSFTVQLPEAVDEAQIETALTALAQRHDMLRCRYMADELGDWSQTYYPESAIGRLQHIDLTGTDTEKLEARLTAIQASLDYQSGPLWQAVQLTGYNDGRSRLILMLHHLIVDAVSWRILATDLMLLLTNQALPAKTSSYRQWVSAVRHYGETILNDGEQLPYWRSVVEDSVPVENDIAAELAPNQQLADLPEQNIPLSFDTELTKQLLSSANQGYQTEINDLLLAALTKALALTFHRSVNHICLEGHGREHIDATLDVSQTVGWFTSMYPVRLSNHLGLEDTIIYTKEMLRAIPDKGLGYGALCVSADDDALKQSLPKISFNYLGQFGGESAQNKDNSDNWQLVTGVMGEPAPIENRAHMLLNINGAVKDGQLQFGIMSRLTEQQTQAFVMHFESAVQSVINQALSRAENGVLLTPSDFGVPEMSMSVLRQIQAQYDVEAVFPATSLQQGFIFHHISQPNDDAYQVQFLLDYTTSLNVERFKQAWQQASLTFPILRTAFNWESEPVQVITRGVSLDDSNFMYHDISDQTEAEREQTITRLQQEDRQHTFDLRKPGLIRFLIIKQQDDLFTVLMNEHHSIGDGWSSPILWGTVHDYYNTLVAGNQPVINVDTAYPDTQRFYQAQRAATESYWAQRKGRYPVANNPVAMLSTPVDLASVKSVDEPAEQSIRIAGDDFSALKAMCMREGLTLNVATQFAWHKILQSYSADSATVVGTTVSGRDVPVEGIERSVGLYINTLPLLVNWQIAETTEEMPDKTASILDVMRAIQQDIADLNSHSAVSLASLQHDGERLFHSLFVYENYPMTAASSEEATQQARLEQSLILKAGIEKVDYPLSLMVFEEVSTDDKGDAQQSLVLKMGHSEQWLSADAAKRVLAQLASVLREVASDPNQSAIGLNIVDEQERELLLHTWNQTEFDYQQPGNLPALFEEQAAKNPDKVAIVFENAESDEKQGEQQLTYGELNDKVNLLAKRIRQRYQLQNDAELPKDTLIALYFDRSMEMIISMLAVMKAGAAYVPISPAFPAHRVAFILNDIAPEGSGQGLMLSHSCKSSTVDSILAGEKLHTQLMFADVELAIDAATVAEETLPAIAPDQLAYVIYTSGTTGTPKGVMIEHAGATDFILSQGQIFKAQHCNSALLFASYVFDASVMDILYSLSFGMTGYLCNESQRNADAIVELMQAHKIQYAFLPPAILKQLTNAQFPYLKVLGTGGEAPSIEFMQAFSEQCTVINAYGPTEFSVAATTHEFKPGDSSTTIGKPLNNAKLYVLDDAKALVPKGVIGELYVSGIGLARGYLNRPEMDKKAFFRNPFVSDAQRSAGYDRMYRTGDLVRYLPTGELEIVGRRDSQVKIRGHRIELGEVEAGLAEFVGAGKAVVVDRKRNDMTYLAAYIVTDAENLDIDLLASRLKQRLPDYMMPATFTPIANIPMTINGKLDKRALPEPEWIDTGKFVAPRSEMEASMCKIWQKILRQNQIGITDDFFRTGGDSISAVKMLAAVKQTLEVNVPVTVLFQMPTIEEISDWLNDEGQSKQTVATPANLVQVLNRRSGSNASELPTIFMIHASGCGSEVYQPLANKLLGQFECVGIDNLNHSDLSPIGDMHQLADTYLQLILDYQTEQGKSDQPVRLLGWSLGGLLAMQIAWKLEQQGRTDIQIVLADTFIYDEQLTGLRQRIDDDALLGFYRDKLLSSAIPPAIIERMVQAYGSEIQMGYRHPSGKLAHAEVVLFKATVTEPRSAKVPHAEAFFQASMARKDNSVASVLEKPLTVINLERTHNDILQETRVMSELIQSRW